MDEFFRLIGQCIIGAGIGIAAAYSAPRVITWASNWLGRWKKPHKTIEKVDYSQQLLDGFITQQAYKIPQAEPRQGQSAQPLPVVPFCRGFFIEVANLPAKRVQIRCDLTNQVLRQDITGMFDGDGHPTMAIDDVAIIRFATPHQPNYLVNIQHVDAELIVRETNH